MERLGIYGGTFNPPHIGHANALCAFARCPEISRILVIPDYLPPHKEMANEIAPSERLEMSRLAFCDIPKVEVSDMELRREGRSYTVDTLRALAKEDRELALLVGTDMFMTLDGWYCAEDIFSMSHIYCVRRECDTDLTVKIAERAEQYRVRFGARIHFLDVNAIEVSSSDLRARLDDDPITAAPLLNERVMDYIMTRGLYR